MQHTKSERKKSVLLRILVILLVFLLFALFSRFRGQGDEVEEANEDLTFITARGAVMESAHRSGAGVFPENTMMAFEGCVADENNNIDLFEFDLHITKDDRLILLHDRTLDRTSDSAEVFGVKRARPENYTLAELNTLNFGAGFTADDGSQPYKGLVGDEVPADLRVTVLEDVLDYLQSVKDFYYIIEIKNSGELGYRAADLLYEILASRGLLDNVIVGTFHGEVTDYITKNYPDMLRSAGILEVAGFWGDFLFNIDREDNYYGYIALQIPVGFAWFIRLDSPGFINRAHRYGIATQYWTINDADTAAALITANADCIMSDYPEILSEAMTAVSP